MQLFARTANILLPSCGLNQSFSLSSPQLISKPSKVLNVEPEEWTAVEGSLIVSEAKPGLLQCLRGSQLKIMDTSGPTTNGVSMEPSAKLFCCGFVRRCIPLVYREELYHILRMTGPLVRSLSHTLHDNVLCLFCMNRELAEKCSRFCKNYILLNRPWSFLGRVCIMSSCMSIWIYMNPGWVDSWLLNASIIMYDMSCILHKINTV